MPREFSATGLCGSIARAWSSRRSSSAGCPRCLALAAAINRFWTSIASSAMSRNNHTYRERASRWAGARPKGMDVNREGQEGVLSPEWLAYRFDEATGEIRFVDYDRATRASAAFLFDQYLPDRPFRAEARERAKELAPATAPLHLIFHSGFCCSTLFARCFDQPGLASSLSEPMILNDVVGWRQRGAAPAEVGRLLSDTLGLLARPFEGDQAVVLKPSTIINGLAPAIMKLSAGSRAVVMYAPLEDHLTSLAKKGYDGRRWGRELFMA